MILQTRFKQGELMKNMMVRVAAVVFSIATMAFGGELAAAQSDVKTEVVQQFVTPAQALYEDSSVIAAVVNKPIHFRKKNLRENVEVKKHGSVFEVEVSGLYFINSFLLVTVPNVGDSVRAIFTINGKKYSNFIEDEIALGSTTIPLFFDEREVYLKKGDKVSVVFVNAPPGTTISERAFKLVVINNTK